MPCEELRLHDEACVCGAGRGLVAGGQGLICKLRVYPRIQQIFTEHYYALVAMGTIDGPYTLMRETDSKQAERQRAVGVHRRGA